MNAVVTGCDAFLTQTKTSPGNVRICTLFFNKTKKNNRFVPVAKAGSIRRSFQPTPGTPLYRRMKDGLVLLLHEVRKWTVRGYTVRTITILFADGQNNDRSVTVDEVRTIVEEMKAAGSHIITARGVNYHNINFQEVFQDMGIDPHQIEVLPGGHEFVASMESTGKGVSAASTDSGSFRETMHRGLGRKTDPGM